MGANINRVKYDCTAGRKKTQLEKKRKASKI